MLERLPETTRLPDRDPKDKVLKSYINDLIRVIRLNFERLDKTDIDNTTVFDEAAQDAVGGILVDTATIDFTYTDEPIPSITADLIDTAVTPGAYGDAANVGQFTVDQQGRLTNAANVPISITSAAIEPDWTMQFMTMGA